MNRPLVAGIGISHPERVFWPDAGISKLELAQYYVAMARFVVPHLRGRPLTLLRCEGTIENCMFPRHARAWGPSALRRVRIQEKTKVGEYLVADDLAGVVALAQMDVIEIHTWNARAGSVDRPDRVVIDLDPGDGVAWRDVVAAARKVRALLESLGLKSWVKTTGGKGLHVVAPIVPSVDWSVCLSFARAVASALARAEPGKLTTVMGKRHRVGKIYLDYLRNNRTNTSIAAFSTRARPDAPVSVPIVWAELSAKRTPDRFTIATVPGRVAKLKADPWKDYWRATQTIPRNAIAALERM